MDQRARRARRTQELVDRIAADPASRAALEPELVELNMVVAREVAHRYEGRGLAAEDLCQVAYLGLVKAARHYDPAKATEFLSFAVPTIRGELRRWFRDAGWTVRPPRSVQELQARIREAQEELWQVLGRAPRPAEIAEHLQESRAHVVDALAASGCFTPSSLDLPAGGEERDVLRDRLGRSEPGYARVDARVALKPLVRDLTPRERRILELRFFADKTQAEIGQEIGVTQMQVSRLLSGILRRLREQLVQPDARGVTSGA